MLKYGSLVCMNLYPNMLLPLFISILESTASWWNNLKSINSNLTSFFADIHAKATSSGLRDMLNKTIKLAKLT